jgi:hypothetical protein
MSLNPQRMECFYPDTIQLEKQWVQSNHQMTCESAPEDTDSDIVMWSCAPWNDHPVMGPITQFELHCNYCAFLRA